MAQTFAQFLREDLKDRAEVNQAYVGRIILFLATAVIAVSGLGNLEQSAGLWIVAAFVAVFHSLGFWMLYQRYFVDLNFFEFYWRKRARNKYSGQAQKAGVFFGLLFVRFGVVEFLLAGSVMAAFLFIVVGFIDQYVSYSIINIATTEATVWLLACYAGAGLLVWVILFFGLTYFWHHGKIKKIEL